MKTSPRLRAEALTHTRPSLDSRDAVAAALVSLALLLAGAVLQDVSLPLVAGERSAFIILAVLGCGACAVGTSSSITARGWRHPANLGSLALSGLAMVVIGLVLAGVRLPALPNDRAALEVLFWLVAAQWLLSGTRLLGGFTAESADRSGGGAGRD